MVERFAQMLTQPQIATPNHRLGSNLRLCCQYSAFPFRKNVEVILTLQQQPKNIGSDVCGAILRKRRLTKIHNENRSFSTFAGNSRFQQK